MVLVQHLDYQTVNTGGGKSNKRTKKNKRIKRNKTKKKRVTSNKKIKKEILTLKKYFNLFIIIMRFLGLISSCYSCSCSSGLSCRS